MKPSTESRSLLSTVLSTDGEREPPIQRRQTGVRAWQSPLWAMARSCPGYANGPDSRAMDKPDRGQDGGGFRRLPEVPKVTRMTNAGVQGQEKCGMDFPKALASDLPNCPHARQAGDKRD